MAKKRIPKSRLELFPGKFLPASLRESRMANLGDKKMKKPHLKRFWREKMGSEYHWLFSRGPYNGLLQSPHNWVVFHPLHTLNYHFFFIAHFSPRLCAPWRSGSSDNTGMCNCSHCVTFFLLRAEKYVQKKWEKNKRKKQLQHLIIDFHLVSSMYIYKSKYLYTTPEYLNVILTNIYTSVHLNIYGYTGYTSI